MKINFLIGVLLFVSSFVYSQTLTDSLQAHYQFDTNLLDQTSFDHDLEILAGRISYSQELSSDQAIVLNGRTHIRTAKVFDNSAYQQIAISLWFKSSTVASVDQIMLQGAFMGFGILIAPQTGKVIGFCDGTSRGSIQSQKSLTDGEWHHIIVQSDGYETSLYVDGELNGSMIEPLVVGNGRYNNRLYIGRSNYGVRPFIGSLNDIRIYNRILTKAEIDLLASNTGKEQEASEAAPLQDQQVEVEPTEHANQRISVSSKVVTVKVWDDQKEDGDIVSIFLNDARIKREIEVENQEHVFTLELKEGVNVFKVLAHNEGSRPPNTAAILVDDGNTEHKAVLSSKKDEFKELIIVVE